MPEKAALFFLPLADNRAIDALVGSADVVHLGHREVGFQRYVTETVGALDAGSILVEPRNEVAQKHHMVA